MSKFKVGDKIVITSRWNNGAQGIITEVVTDDPNDQYGFDNSYYVDIYKGERGELVYEHDLRLAKDSERNIFVESLYQSQLDHDSYFSEMATIAFTNKLNVAVNPERRTLNIPYFKVYDNGKVDASKKVARLHFKDSGIEIHKHDKLGKKPWIPSNDDIKNIKSILIQPDPTRDNLYTVWQVLCYEWNRINDLIPVNTTIKEYVSGKCDNQRFNDTRLETAYVLSDTEIPKTWEYDASKSKRNKERKEF